MPVCEHQTTRGKIRDPRWLRIEVCRDFTRDEKCERGDEQCRFAHPGKNCIVVAGKVTACYDSMKGRCNRENCKYYHPPDHLKKYIQALGKAFEQQRFAEEQNGFFGGNMSFNSPTVICPTNAPLFQLNQNIMQTPRRLDFSDKLPICRFFASESCKKPADDCQFAHPPPSVDVDPHGFVTVCMDFISERCDRDNCRYFHPPQHLKARVKAMQLRHAPLSPLPEVNSISESLNQTKFVPVMTTTSALVYPPTVSYVQGTPQMFMYNMQTPMGQVTYPYGPLIMNDLQVPAAAPCLLPN